MTPSWGWTSPVVFLPVTPPGYGGSFNLARTKTGGSAPRPPPTFRLRRELTKMERHGQPVSLLTEVWSSWASRFGGQALGVRPSVAGVVGPLSPGPEWSTGYPDLQSDRTPLARVRILFFRIIRGLRPAVRARPPEWPRFRSRFWSGVNWTELPE